MYRNWKSGRISVSGAVLLAALLAGCPDEPVVNGPPDMGPGDVPPPPPPGQMGQPGPPVGNEPAPESQAEGPADNPGEESAAEGNTSANEPSEGQPGPGEGTAPLDDGKPVPRGQIPFSPLPESALSQEEVKKGNAITVKGTLEGEMCAGKTTRIEVVGMEDNRPSMLTAMIHQGVGAFEISLPKSAQKLWITALCDVNGNNALDWEEDYVAAYKSNPIKPAKDLTDIQMVFQPSGKDDIEGMPPVPE